jgi:hypothetical protein
VRVLAIVAALVALGVGSGIAAYELRLPDERPQVEPIDLKPSPPPVKPKRANGPTESASQPPDPEPTGGAAPATPAPAPTGGSSESPPPPGGDDDDGGDDGTSDDDGEDDGED